MSLNRRSFVSWVVFTSLVCLSAVALPAASPATGLRAVATFAGGCFWCMEASLEKVPGVLSVTSGYAGGQKKNPTYDEVSSGGTGHAESVQVVYDSSTISYAELLRVFWRNVDPLTPDAQFCDHGSQYRSVVFFHDEAQRKAAVESKAALEASKRFGSRKLVTEIAPVGVFYPAEEYHQDFYKKNPVRYHSYRQGCGRDQRLRELWGDEAGGGK